MENQAVETKNVFCRKHDREVSKESCRKCDAWLADDIYNLWNRCRHERDRYEALYKLYRKKGGDK